MDGAGLVRIHRFLISCPSQLPPNLSDSRIRVYPKRFEVKKVSDFKRVGLNSSSMAASASSSASLSGSGAQYPEQSLGAKPKPKTKRIAGIDQDELLDPALLADPDSCFCEFKGVQIHHKVYDAESSAQSNPQFSSHANKIGLPMILLHGFGASVFSWHRVMKHLAQAIGSKVLAFDRPAFGLTSRVNPHELSSTNTEETRPLNPYSMVFSVLATLYFIDSLAAKKAILVGHSAGSLVAVNTYFEAPKRVAALVLVAPAIVAPLNSHKVDKENQFKAHTQMQKDSSNSNEESNLFIRICESLSKFSRYIVEAILHLVRGMGEMFNSLYKKALSGFLHSALAVMLIRMVIDKFGIAAVRNAWYNSNQVTEHVLYGYTKPLRAKGWDKALVEYIAAMLADPSLESKPPISNRLDEISCPVLIVTGDRDGLVPTWNSERLAKAIPGSHLQVIKNCGHLPHEEKPEEFLSVVEKFLHTVFSGTQEKSIQVAT